jgi:hypothetical protein
VPKIGCDNSSGMNEVAQQVCKDAAVNNEHFSAWMVLIGVVVGSVLTVLGNIVMHCLKERSLAKKDKPRKQLLIKMLEDDRFADHWRKLDTLSHVIGANEETTKRLLIELGARGSEDQQELWGLIKHHPFEKKQ